MRARAPVPPGGRSCGDPIGATLPVNGKPTEFDITLPMRTACQRIVGPIVEGFLGDGVDLIATVTTPAAQAAFQAGYLAAGMSKSGKVGTYGAVPIPPVTIFMDGFKQGAEYYAEENGKDVEVVGWDGKNGSFTGGFEANEKATNTARQILDQGADVVILDLGGAPAPDALRVPTNRLHAPAGQRGRHRAQQNAQSRAMSQAGSVPRGLASLAGGLGAAGAHMVTIDEVDRPSEGFIEVVGGVGPVAFRFCGGKQGFINRG